MAVDLSGETVDRMPSDNFLSLRAESTSQEAELEALEVCSYTILRTSAYSAALTSFVFKSLWYTL